MIFALAKFSALVKAFNRRALTERMFFKICAEYNISVGFVDIPTLLGFHTNINGKLSIFLDKNLKGYEFLFIAFHELAHALLHESTEPVSVSFYNQFETRHEAEAEAVALVALFPTRRLKELEDELIYADEFAAFLIKKRLEIFKQTGI
jgi:Predicted Zn peptidase